MTVWDVEKARWAGMRPLTVGYALPAELPMALGVLRDLRRGGIACALVRPDRGRGVEVWRDGEGMLFGRPIFGGEGEE